MTEAPIQNNLEAIFFFFQNLSSIAAKILNEIRFVMQVKLVISYICT